MKSTNLFLVLLIAGVASFSGIAKADEVQDALEAKLKAAAQNTPAEKKLPLSTTVDALAKLSDETIAPTCINSKQVSFGGAYVLVLDEKNEPCRIYDLSFPTLQTFLGNGKGKQVSQIPMHKYTARDYWDFFIGNPDAVLERHKNDASLPVDSNWVQEVTGVKAAPGLNTLAAMDMGLPESFHASDLMVGDFQLDPQTRSEVLRLGAQVRSLTGDSEKSAQMDFWRTLANNPKSFLAKIRFDKNDAKKVYDVFLEGTFLPIKGPVVMVDYQAQYRPAVDGMVRSLIHDILQSVTRAIPDPKTRNLVYVVVRDSFGFLNQMYSYQNAGLEAALREQLTNPSPGMSADIATKALNIQFGAQGGAVMQQLIIGQIQGKKTDWTNVAKIGKQARYDAEKIRAVRRANTNSRLVLKSGCQMTLLGDSFGICRKKDKASVYSLVSSNTFLGQDFGAPMIYSYSQPYRMSVLRGAAWVMSAAALIIPVPGLESLARQLSNELQVYSQTGVVDESRLRQALLQQKRAGKTLDQGNATMLQYLYIQNINPFLPKTEEVEANIVRKNADLLK